MISFDFIYFSSCRIQQLEKIIESQKKEINSYENQFEESNSLYEKKIQELQTEIQSLKKKDTQNQQVSHQK